MTAFLATISEDNKPDYQLIYTYRKPKDGKTHSYIIHSQNESLKESVVDKGKV